MPQPLYLYEILHREKRVTKRGTTITKRQLYFDTFTEMVENLSIFFLFFFFDPNVRFVQQINTSVLHKYLRFFVIGKIDDPLEGHSRPGIKTSVLRKYVCMYILSLKKKVKQRFLSFLPRFFFLSNISYNINEQCIVENTVNTKIERFYFPFLLKNGQ